MDRKRIFADDFEDTNNLENILSFDDFVHSESKHKIRKLLKPSSIQKDEDLILGISLSKSLMSTKSYSTPFSSIVIFPESDLIIQRMFLSVLGYWNEISRCNSNRRDGNQKGLLWSLTMI